MEGLLSVGLLHLVYQLAVTFQLNFVHFHCISPWADSVYNLQCLWVVDMLFVCPLRWQPEMRELETSG